MKYQDWQLMSKEKKILPELRFPEFVNDGEWVEKELSEVAEIVTGNTPSTKESKYYGGEIMFVSPADISENRYVEKTKTTLTSIGYSKTRHIKPNSVLFVCIGSTIGKVAQNKFSCATNQQINSLIPNKENSSDFLYSNLEHNAIKIAELAGKQAVPIINKSLFSSVTLLFPFNLEEQQKIASCLSFLDELINAHSDKLETLKDHKKGLMQNLFPQKGQKVPNYRFPEFEKDGEWVEKELSEVAEIVTGNTPSTKESKYYGGEIMFVSPADISENRYVEKTKTTLTSIGYSKTRHIKPNSVLFVCIGSTIGKVAQNKFSCATNQQINSLIPNKENSSDFLYSNLEHNAIKIAELAGKQAVPIINKSLFSSVTLLFPFNLEEQQKIASCLSALDELITAKSEKIEQLQQHKKGLMQGLFPNANK